MLSDVGEPVADSTSPAPPGLFTDAVAVECARVRKQYPDGTMALRDVSLHCAAGQITVLLGPSGCGKTTLLRSIAGLTEPTGGRISIDGVDVTNLEPRLRGVAMVFQGSALYPDKTAYGNIEFPLRMERVPKRERRERVAAVAGLLGLSDLLQRRPAELSGGQRQRVGIGRALVRRPKVVLMDEPFSALDAELRVRMRTELLTLQRDLGMTVVYVTHDQIEALTLADQLVVMQQGSIEQHGDPELVFREPETEYVATFLGAMNILQAASMGEALMVQRGFGDNAVATVGFRAEDVQLGLSVQPGDLNLAGPILGTELMGRERLVHIALAHHQIRARIHADEPVGPDAQMHVEQRNLHFFDQHGRRAQPPNNAARS